MQQLVERSKRLFVVGSCCFTLLFLTAPLGTKVSTSCRLAHADPHQLVFLVHLSLGLLYAMRLPVMLSSRSEVRIVLSLRDADTRGENNLEDQGASVLKSFLRRLQHRLHGPLRTSGLWQLPSFAAWPRMEGVSAGLDLYLLDLLFR